MKKRSCAPFGKYFRPPTVAKVIADHNKWYHGQTMKTYLQCGQRVLKSARRTKAKVGQCTLAGYLFLRPSGPKFNGGMHRGALGFAAYDVDKLLAWDPLSGRKLLPLWTFGSLIRIDTAPDPVGVPFVADLPLRQSVQRDRWAQLAADGERRGNARFVGLSQFVELFLRTKQDPKQQASKLGKRLRSNGCEVSDSCERRTIGRPRKLAKLTDLKALFPQFV